MQLNITKRPCQLGSAVNTRCEKHGDDDVPACDIPVAGIMLERQELNVLLGDKYADRALFTERDKFKQPMFPQLKAFALKDKFEGATVRLQLGVAGHGDTVELIEAKIARVTFEPKAGGLTELSLQVQAAPDPEVIGEIIAWLNREVSIEIIDGKKAERNTAQGELPINNFGEGEQAEVSQEKGGGKKRRRNGERPEAH